MQPPPRQAKHFINFMRNFPRCYLPAGIGREPTKTFALSNGKILLIFYLEYNYNIRCSSLRAHRVPPPVCWRWSSQPASQPLSFENSYTGQSVSQSAGWFLLGCPKKWALSDSTCSQGRSDPLFKIYPFSKRVEVWKKSFKMYAEIPLHQTFASRCRCKCSNTVMRF